jgi:prepilin-type processing-associated H-X9-DG protein
LSKAREKARAIQCASNQKQIGLLFAMYSQENGGFTPCNYTSSTAPYNVDWRALILGLHKKAGTAEVYEGTPNSTITIFDCPSAQVRKASYLWDAASMFGSSFGSIGIMRLDAWNGVGWYTPNHVNTDTLMAVPEIATWKQPSQSVHTGDSVHGANPYSYPSIESFSDAGGVVGSNWILNLGKPTVYKGTGYDRFSTRHAGRTNVLMVDGHVESPDIKALENENFGPGTDCLWDGF